MADAVVLLDGCSEVGVAEATSDAVAKPEEEGGAVDDDSTLLRADFLPKGTKSISKLPKLDGVARLLLLDA